jgi:outer membrane lipoprotein carrier protein
MWLAVVFLVGLIGYQTTGYSQTLEGIIKGIETRYSASGFSTRFFQTSTLKAMEITENASGIMMVKRPGMMRWEYDEPERQLVVTDGNKLWVYRPDDNQVMVGEAPVFFGDGKGAGFLSDIERVRDNFVITLDGMTKNSHYRLKLVPKKKTFEI